MPCRKWKAKDSKGKFRSRKSLALDRAKKSKAEKRLRRKIAG